MPRLGVTMQEGTLNTWLVSEGESVDVGDIIAEIESEKSNVEIEAQVSGSVKKILVEEGEKVKVGKILAVIGSKDEEIDIEEVKKQDLKPEDGSEEIDIEEEQEKKKEAEYQAEDSPRAVPRARKLAQNENIDISTIEGTGPGGLIKVEDVEKRIEKAKGTDKSEEPNIMKKESLSPSLKSMAKNISKSWNEIPQYTQVVEVNAENILQVKNNINLSFNSIFIKAIADTIEDHPYINSCLEGDDVHFYKEINIGIAVAKGKDLFVPVIKDVSNKSLEKIDKEIRRLAQKDSFTQEDLSHGTITFSNLGYYGIESGVSIINYPQSCLIFVGKIKKIPRVNEKDEIIVVRAFNLAITYDHRYISGAIGAEFTRDLKDNLELFEV